MFDNDDDNDDGLEGLTEFERWYDSNIFYFPKEPWSSGYDSVEIQSYYYGVYKRAMSVLPQKIEQLMFEQYPELGDELRPDVLEEISETAASIGPEMLARICVLLQEDKLGTDFRKKFDNFESMIDFYGRPEKPHYLEREFFDRFDWLTEEQKQQFIDENRQEADEAVEWKESRKKAFFDIVLDLMLKYCPSILSLSPDGFIVYAIYVREEYETYIIRTERIASIVEYNFPLSYLELPYSEFLDKASEAYRKKHEEEMARLNSESQTPDESTS